MLGRFTLNGWCDSDPKAELRPARAGHLTSSKRYALLVAIQSGGSGMEGELAQSNLSGVHLVQESSLHDGNSWPSLVNPRAHELIDGKVWNALLERQAAMGRLGKFWWRIRRRWHAFRRGVFSFCRGIYDEIASTPKKTLFDIATGLPLGLLALPPFRAWAFRFAWAWEAYAILIIARILYSAWRRGSLKILIRDEIGSALHRVTPIIECSRIHVMAKGHSPLPASQLQHNIETVLCAVRDLAVQALQVPKGTGISANLMVRMPVLVKGTDALCAGCGIVAYNAIPASPSWTRLLIGDLGAAKVFETGKVQAVEDTTDPVWCGIFKGNRSKCFASFPVRNEWAEVIAVVNIDADRPQVFTRKNAALLFTEVLTPALKLLGDLLIAASKETLTPSSEDHHANVD